MAGGDAGEPHDPDRRLDHSGAADDPHSRGRRAFSSAVIVDLRIWRLLQRDVPLPDVARRFLPVIWPVVLILLLTGSLLIIGEPRRSLLNTTFYFKMTLLAVALVLTGGLQWSLSSAPEFWDKNRGRRDRGNVCRDRLHPCLVRHPLCRTLDRLYAGRLMLQPQDVIAFLEGSSLADSIRENDVLFPLIESVHVLAICLVVGSILAVDLRLLGVASIRTAGQPRYARNFAADLGRVCRRCRIRRPAVHFQRHEISRQRLLHRQALSDRCRRAEHAGLSSHQRQGSAEMGRAGAAAAVRTAGRRTIDLLVDRGGRVRTLDRLYHAGWVNDLRRSLASLFLPRSLSRGRHRHRWAKTLVAAALPSLMST